MTVVEWLLDSDPAIRWQALRDLTDASEGEVAAERARVAAEGWGARLLEELPIVADPASGAELGRSWRLMPDGRGG
jgi:hypothetical protein